MQTDRVTFLVVEQTLPDGITLAAHRRARAAQRRRSRTRISRLLLRSRVIRHA